MAKSNTPKAPPELDGEAATEWKRVVAELKNAGRLDKTDRAILTLYANTWAMHAAAMAGVREHGLVIQHSTGAVGASPYVKLARETAVILRGLLTDLGMTPTSRSTGDAPPLGELEI